MDPGILGRMITEPFLKGSFFDLQSDREQYWADVMFGWKEMSAREIEKDLSDCITNSEQRMKPKKARDMAVADTRELM